MHPVPHDPRLLARLRGGFAGGTSAAVSIAAHAIAGGGYPGENAITFLLAVVVVVGIAAGGTRLPVVVLLAGGQVLGHLALSLGDGVAGSHLHVPEPSMLAAHALAIGIAAALVHGAERGCALALSALGRLVPRGWRSTQVRPAATMPVTYRPPVLRPQLATAGPTPRGPPLVTV
ncbi:hypothetical membrane protein [Rhodococcus coprophilus]|uniref:Hypothetical membrane protein n=1 Tax=Rhodococcus coprophilus TaxID=38310 RepID=A0A2X4UDL9_9NOCA|nr:hypothetical membrane protein [Rhodococcus coprophilus]